MAEVNEFVVHLPFLMKMKSSDVRSDGAHGAKTINSPQSEEYIDRNSKYIN